MADPTLQIIVKMKDMFSKQLDAVHKTVTKNTSKMRTAFANMGKAVTSLKGKIGLLIGAWASWRGVTAAWNAVKTYGKLEAVRTAFEILRKDVGIAADALDDWRKIVNATVSDADLLTAVNKAIMGDWVRGKKDIDALANAALNMGRIAGEDVAPSFEKLVQYISNVSPRALKPLGIAMEDIWRAEAAIAGGPLPQIVRQHLMLDALIEKQRTGFGEISKLQTTVSEKVQQSQVHWGNVEENIGEMAHGMADVNREFSNLIELLTKEAAKASASWFKKFSVEVLDFVLAQERAAERWKAVERDIGHPMPGDYTWEPPKEATEDRGGRLYKAYLDAGIAAADKQREALKSTVADLGEDVVIAQQSLCEKLQMHAINTAKAIGDGVAFIAEKSADAFNAFWGEGGQRNKETGELIRMGGGVIGGVEAYGEEVKDVALNIAEGVQDIFRAMEDSISDFFFDAMMGKLKTFKDYLRSFLQSIARIMSQIMSRVLMAGIGGGLGLPGFTTTTPAVGTKQKGGIVTRPELTWIGEGGRAEAVVPLPDNRSIPVKFSGGGTGAPVNVYFNVNTIDSTTFGLWLQRHERQVQGMISKAVGRDPQFRAGFRAI